MDHFLEQTFQIDSLKIGAIRYAGILKIGASGTTVRKTSNVHGATGYVTLETSPTIFTPAVPLQSPIRKILKS